MWIARPIFIGALVVFFSSLLYAQEIDIRVLNGHNGKPVTNECLDVWVGIWKGAHLVAGTNGSGVAVLHVTETEIQAQTACPGWSSRAAILPDVNGIMVTGDWYVACQEYQKIVPGGPLINPLEALPSYPIKKILASGISGSNTCGKIRAEAKPGELVFYVRPRSFWEKIRQ